MIEKIYNFSKGHERKIDKIVNDDDIMINHMTFFKGEGLAEHYSNSNVYMIVLSGILTLQLDEQEDHKYTSGSIINIPYKTKMNVTNLDEDTLELFVVKAPNPRNYKE